MTTRLRIVGPEEAPPPPQGFSVLELACIRCGQRLSAVRWPGGRWTFQHACAPASPPSALERLLDSRWAPDVVSGAFAIVLVALMAVVFSGR